MGSLMRKAQRNKTSQLDKFKEIERNKKYANSRQESDRFGFILHCDGVKHGNISHSCKNSIIVPMVSLQSVEELHEQVKPQDWRVSVGSAEFNGERYPIAFVQCTECWIEFYRSFASENEDPEEVYKSIDPEGKFWDRLKVSESKDSKNESNDSHNEAESSQNQDK